MWSWSWSWSASGRPSVLQQQNLQTALQHGQFPAVVLPQDVGQLSTEVPEIWEGTAVRNVQQGVEEPQPEGAVRVSVTAEKKTLESGPTPTLCCPPVVSSGPPHSPSEDSVGGPDPVPVGDLHVGPKQQTVDGSCQTKVVALKTQRNR